MVVFGGCGAPLDQPPIVMVFDMQTGKWKSPQVSGAPPRQRQGHTANAVQEDRHLCVFGGIEPTGEQKVARVYNDAHLLDLQSFSWRKMEMIGHRPHARFGHTATNLPGSSGKLLVVGGRDHLSGSSEPVLAGSFTGLHILDSERRTWSQQPFSGTPPLQAFYHSASLIDDRTVLFLASGAAVSDTFPMYLLSLDTWHWSAPRSSGVGPAPRIGHVAAAVGTRVYMFGGLFMNGEQSFVDKSVYVLETARELDRVQKEAPVGSVGTPRGGQQGSHGVKNERSHKDGVRLRAVSGPHDKDGDEAHGHGHSQNPAATAKGPAPSVAAASCASALAGVAGHAHGHQGPGVAAAITHHSKNEKPKGDKAKADVKAKTLDENDFDEDLDDATELSFEELLEQEKAFFKSQSEKPYFPRAKDKDLKKGLL